MNKIFLSLTAALGLLTCSAQLLATPLDYKIDVWADNWFSAYLDGAPLLEDSVSIKTERSFNAESLQFSASAPFVFAFIVKDFKQNDTGLEYIGSRRQQMGDGGFITQITNMSTDKVVASSNATMRCTVIHRAPLESSCVSAKKPIAGQGACQFQRLPEPQNWQSATFDDSAWPLAIEYSAAAVRPKQGYNQISWDSSAKLIWSDDLEKDNTLLCRLRVDDTLDTSSAPADNTKRHSHFKHFSNVSTRVSGSHLQIASNGIPEHNMMEGITNWQQQVPVPQDYTGSNSWQIPLHPVLANSPMLSKEHFHKGAVAIAVNGVPIFNALNNRGEYAADIGELDHWGGHSGKADDYHYHLAPEHLETHVGAGNPIAYALDGFPLYGKTNKPLDKYLGRMNETGSYQYHAVDYPPYFIAGMRGVVKTDAAGNAPEDQIVPQPRSLPVRNKDYGPLKGASITLFKRISQHNYSLEYRIGKIDNAINYSWDDSGHYVFRYRTGKKPQTIENYSANRQLPDSKMSPKENAKKTLRAGHKGRRFCGDNLCDNTETKHSCPADC